MSTIIGYKEYTIQFLNNSERFDVRIIGPYPITFLDEDNELEALDEAMEYVDAMPRFTDEDDDYVRAHFGLEAGIPISELGVNL